MNPIGLLIEFKDGRVKEANFGLATAARGKNRQLIALVVDASAGDARRALEAFGVTRIVNITTGSRRWDPAIRAAAVVAAMEQFEISSLVGLTSPAGRELLPRIAARLDAALVMDCIELDLDGRRVKTSQYSGKTMATIALTGSHFIYGMGVNAVAPLQCQVTAEIIDFAFEGNPDPGYRVIETRTDSSGTQYLAESDVIISGGRGLKNAENFNLLIACAGHINNASVGASRVAVDNGWVPYAMQVGQTGVKVNPKVYLAAGISGSIQHVAGMKTAKTIIAINTDENAAIMANCDYFAVGDLFEILPELEKALAAVRRP
ncbi:electron transfer flavoprotein subunit alpha [Desulfosarcina alkanivorans]|jgi:electron transfer flavoprotein alpha subunit|uniref:Electron transfer flavoprotein subunit alpha n=1 Tax=Desulfosarcina alkanivorans TaxID=571177 RepID=A0A5K7YUV6_9BACT|nr:electron transfer flavoprotein subunit alpha/FixB family protein [Desulfosarcina alkanivorans]BBO71809.1 electron transfer flavoprotein subunit alpha [Desulfosarcina alkanivorans]